MTSQTAMSLMCLAEVALWAVFGFLFWSRKLHRRFPAMGSYLALRLISAPIFLVLVYATMHTTDRRVATTYFFIYWPVYLASAVLLYFICLEVFRSALAAFSGLLKFGTLIFHWAALASVILSLSTIFSTQRDLHKAVDWTYWITVLSYRLMRSVSVLELCLLGFLCLSMNALRLSERDLAFGISLGFGVMSSSDFILASFIPRNSTLTMPLQFVSESVILLAIGIWTAYVVFPEPEREPVVIPANSTIYRWNEIASALGHTGTKVAVQQSNNGLLLNDVELLANRVMVKSRE